MQTAREESIIFSDLDKLCSCPGYAHVIAFFCFRDNTTLASDELNPEIIQESYTPERLIRTEISTL